MRRAAMVVVLSVVVGGMALVGAPPAGACSMVWPGPTEEELLARAELVFEGVAVSRHDPNASAPIRSSGDPIVWTFAVDRQIKGTASQPQEVSSARSGASCGMAFQIGTRYVVFADLVDGVYRTSLGSGTREASVEPGTTTTTTTTTRPPVTTTTVVAPRPTRTSRIALTG